MGDSFVIDGERGGEMGGRCAEGVLEVRCSGARMMWLTGSYSDLGRSRRMRSKYAGGQASRRRSRTRLVMDLPLRVLSTTESSWYSEQ